MAFSTLERAAIVGELLRFADTHPNRTVPTGLVRFRASELGVGESTVWRWLAEARSGEQAERGLQHPDLDDLHIEVIIGCGGNLTRAKEKLDQDDPRIAAMSERTFRRRWDALPAGLRAMAEGGAEASLQQQLRIVYSTDERNRVWHADHQQMPIWIIPNGHTTPTKPWLTTIIDDCSRRIMATLLTVESATAESLVVTVAEAVRIRTDNGVQVGGMPVELHSDNGAEFRSNRYLAATVALGIQSTRTYPYMKHQNGKAERVQQTMQKELLAGIVGYAHGGRTLSRTDLFGVDGPLLHQDAFSVLLETWVDGYNNDRTHSMIGMTPNQKWASFNGGLKAPDEQALRLAMMTTDRTRKVQPSGVFFNNQYYTSSKLGPWIGRQVQVKYFPSEERFIEVFGPDGDWIGTAYQQVNLTAAQRKEILEESRKSFTEARGFQKRAAERRRAEALADPELAHGLSLEHLGSTASGLTGNIDDFLGYDDEDDVDEKVNEVMVDKVAEASVGTVVEADVAVQAGVEVDADVDDETKAEAEEEIPEAGDDDGGELA